MKTYDVPVLDNKSGQLLLRQLLKLSTSMMDQVQTKFHTTRPQFVTECTSYLYDTVRYQIPFLKQTVRTSQKAIFQKETYFPTIHFQV